MIFTNNYLLYHLLNQLFTVNLMPLPFTSLTRKEKMRKRKFLIFSLSLVLTINKDWKTTYAKIKTTNLKTAKEYFLLIPEKYIKLAVGERKNILEKNIIEENNDYLSLEYNAKRIQMKVYKKRNKKIILVLYILEEKIRKNATQEIYFLEPNNWNDITKECLSNRLFGRNDIIYKLLKDSSTITIYSLDDILWFELESTEDGFIAVSAIE